ncbi:hypothetical protein [Alkalicoccus halolimnae]|uniref:Uncharacterized protein n=1 Tax=Alkalicoccus halolimnae TaxID=1667239 RepID=A0A5C7F3T8_9BACI|nr:hypothetical protein [Alkalicoccus halolimnae]TXF85331.1 hypothetical protein FTX54_09115 [Alkalicoccus halolimnae]
MSLLREDKQKTWKRPPEELMIPERIGAFRVNPLSFSRSVLRKANKEQWQIDRVVFDLDAGGNGEIIYRIQTEGKLFHFILLSHEIIEEDRNDRVVSERWDMTCALCEGEVSPEKLIRLRKELPKQESGRGEMQDIVWSRANRSSRVFDEVVDLLSKGKQPHGELLIKTGYLVRSTAFYANGKFGLAPFDKLSAAHPFAGAFRAQMFTAYLLRQASFDIIEHIAKCKNESAVSLSQKWKRYLGVGNATGLGMVPFLMYHPKLIHRWIDTREEAVSRVKNKVLNTDQLRSLETWLEHSIAYFREYNVDGKEAFHSPEQMTHDCLTALKRLQNWKVNTTSRLSRWGDYMEAVKPELTFEGEEFLHSLLMEINIDSLLDLENQSVVNETYDFEPEMKIGELIKIIESDYRWAFQFDFTHPQDYYYFWFRSREKEEPRIGVAGKDAGSDKALRLDYARQIQQLYSLLTCQTADDMAATFVLAYPHFKPIIKRVQSLVDWPYGEIQGNLLGKNLIPLYLLRCKLSLFGAERFSPKSNEWVRVTLFQGAPTIEELNDSFSEGWILPLLPKQEE